MIRHLEPEEYILGVFYPETGKIRSSLGNINGPNITHDDLKRNNFDNPMRWRYTDISGVHIPYLYRNDRGFTEKEEDLILDHIYYYYGVKQ